MSIGSPAYFIDDGSSLGSHMPSSSSEIEYLCPPSSLTVYSSSVSIFFSYKIISFNLADTKYLYKCNFLKAVNLQIPQSLSSNLLLLSSYFQKTAQSSCLHQNRHTFSLSRLLLFLHSSYLISFQ